MSQVQIEIPREQVEAFCRKWMVKELSLFGSVLREDFRPDSDVDVLIEFLDEAPWDLFHWVDMIDELKALFGRNVDLVEKGGLRNPFRRHAILSSKRRIYAG